MARSCLLVLSLVVLATVRVDGAPAPSVDCTDALPSLAGCLSYVQEGSTVTVPDPTCCSGLKDVVRKEVACLCQVFQGGQNFGVTLNMTKALQLPAACKVKTPPFSKCNISVPGVIGEAPVPAPSSGAPFFGQPPSSSTPPPSSSTPPPPPSSTPTPTPSSSTPSASPAGTGSDANAQAPSPARSEAASFSASTQIFFAAVAVVSTLLAHRGL